MKKRNNRNNILKCTNIVPLLATQSETSQTLSLECNGAVIYFTITGPLQLFSDENICLTSGCKNYL